MSRPFTEIPVLDLSLADNADTRPQLLEALRYVLTDIGFLYITNHGADKNVIEDLINVLPKLFALPPSAKAEVALENSPHFLGYSRTGTETTAGNPDFREQFEFATELAASWQDGDPLSERLRGPNQVRTVGFGPHLVHHGGRSL